MPEGNQGDTTCVKFVLTYGPLVRVSFFFEPIDKVAEPVGR
jgi:hypothetical protein